MNAIEPLGEKKIIFCFICFESTSHDRIYVLINKEDVME